MGHDITLFKKVKYIRRSAFSKDVKYMYKALDCEEYNGGASGGGGSVFFTKYQLPDIKDNLQWLRKLHKKGIVGKDIVDFIQDVVDILKTDGEVFIDFS